MINEQVIADNRALIKRNRELECELARLKARLGAVGRIADELYESAAELVESCGDGPMSKEDARFCAFKYYLSCGLRDAIW